MDNFYTATVYNKGAEVVRLYETVLGKSGFRKGMDLYFKRHDGQAVTCDDFLAAMADANNTDLSSLGKWYGQAGTPTVTVECGYDATAGGSLTLKFTQTVAPTRGQTEKVPVLVPIRLALINPVTGGLIPLTLAGKGDLGATETVLWFTEKEQTFLFENVGSSAKPVPSLFRSFSAPVKVVFADQTDEDLQVILQHDTDPFNRYEAGQVLARKIMLALYNGQENFEGVGVPPALIAAFRALLADDKLDGTFKALALTLPSRDELTGSIPNCNPVRLFRVADYIAKTIARALRDLFEAVVIADEQQQPAAAAAYVFNAREVARRAIVNRSYSFLNRLEDPAIEARILARMRRATNMTDEFAMLVCLNAPHCTASRSVALAEFAEKWKDEPLVMLKWLTIQAACEIPNNVPAVKNLMDCKHFTITNPNCCYSLLLGFGQSAMNFHAEDGSGYRFAADNVLLVDKVNHQVASRLVGDLSPYKQYDAVRQKLMREQLQRILATEGISDNIREIVQKSLE
jgi:aminopeptidase N